MLTNTLVKVALLGAEWVLYVLVVLSALAVALIVERLLVFRRSQRFLGALETRLLGFTDRERRPVQGVERSKEHRLLNALHKATSRADADPSGQLTNSQVEGAVAAYRRYLERFTAVLGTLGNNAPFVGLLGTVIGVIVAFNQLSIEMEGGAGSVMSGISEALVATATGIAVAIPCVVFYNYFVKIVEAYTERFSLLAWSQVRGEAGGSKGSESPGEPT